MSMSNEPLISSKSYDPMPIYIYVMLIKLPYQRIMAFKAHSDQCNNHEEIIWISVQQTYSRKHIDPCNHNIQSWVSA